MAASSTNNCTVTDVTARPAAAQARRSSSASPKSLLKTMPATPTADREVAEYDYTENGNRAQVSAFSAFMQIVDRYPVLSAEAQGELVAAYQHALDVKDLLDAGEYSGVHRRRATRIIQQGQRHLEYLAGANFRLVLTISKEQAIKRFGRARAMELIPDLVSEGSAALTEAAQKYDPSRAPTFPTYGARAVRDRIRTTISQTGQVKLANSWARMRRIAKARIPALEEELGRRPTRDEIQESLLEKCMEWAEGRLTADQQQLPRAKQREIMYAKLKKQGMIGAIEHIDEVLRAPVRMASLDKPVGEDGDASLGDFLEGEDDTEHAAGVELEELRESIRLALGQLTERERDIVLRRYGFHDGEEWTYARIAEIWDVTAERIRQIERAVLDRLGQPHAHYAHLSSHLDSQFEQAPDPDDSPSSTLARRRSR